LADPGKANKARIGTQMAPTAYRLLPMAPSIARAAAASVFEKRWPYERQPKGERRGCP
jgi:hypothetical protein